VNFVADENIDRQIVDGLRQIGHEVWSIAEQESGIADELILEQARVRMAILITGDKDFGELVFRMLRVSHGVVLIRLPGLSPTTRADRVVAVIADLADRIVGSFTVIDSTGVRVRPATRG
jgi:predicted nuclease of predicted toxin-antitoxin system